MRKALNHEMPQIQPRLLDHKGLLCQPCSRNVLEECHDLMSFLVIIPLVIVNDILEVIDPCEDILRCKTREEFWPDFSIGTEGKWVGCRRRWGGLLLPRYKLHDGLIGMHDLEDEGCHGLE